MFAVGKYMIGQGGDDRAVRGGGRPDQGRKATALIGGGVAATEDLCIGTAIEGTLPGHQAAFAANTHRTTFHAAAAAAAATAPVVRYGVRAGANRRRAGVASCDTRDVHPGRRQGGKREPEQVCWSASISNKIKCELIAYHKQFTNR